MLICFCGNAKDCSSLDSELSKGCQAEYNRSHLHLRVPTPTKPAPPAPEPRLAERGSRRPHSHNYSTCLYVRSTLSKYKVTSIGCIRCCYGLMPGLYGTNRKRGKYRVSERIGIIPYTSRLCIFVLRVHILLSCFSATKGFDTDQGPQGLVPFRTPSTMTTASAYESTVRKYCIAARLPLNARNRC